MANDVYEADYVIIGAGAMGMAFADVILKESDADIILIDRHHKPGGHWNLAYPFVTLHQPSSFYGVPSAELSTGETEKVGFNAGLSEMASGDEIMAYFDRIMRQDFLPSGRVQFFPMHKYKGGQKFTSITSGKQKTFTARKKIIDCTYLKTTVPSNHKPSFDVAAGVQFMPLNNLPRLEETPAGYVVIGGGKTGIDAILWLLQHDVDPDHISWVVSRDAWLLNRKNAQTTFDFFDHTMGSQAGQFEAIAQSTSIENMFERLEECGYFTRLYDQTPEMFHGATVSEKEIEALRRVKNIVRLGKVTKIDRDEITFVNGTMPTSPNHLHIDCSATPIHERDATPIFNGNVITPQTVRAYQPIFSAAFIAHIELTMDDEATKNDLCGIVDLPNADTDYIKFTLAAMTNQYKWAQNPALRDWMLHNRLDGFSAMVAQIDPNDKAKIDIMKRIKSAAFPAVAKLTAYMAELD